MKRDGADDRAVEAQPQAHELVGAPQRVAWLISEQVRSVLTTTLEHADGVRAAGEEQRLARIGSARESAQHVRNLVDDLATRLAEVVQAVRQERVHLLRAEASLRARVEPQLVLDLRSARELGSAESEEDVSDAEVVTDEPEVDEAEGLVTPGPPEEFPPAEASDQDGSPGTEADATEMPRPQPAGDQGLGGIPAPTRFLDLPTEEDDTHSGVEMPGGTLAEGARPCMACSGSGECSACGGRGKRLRAFRCKACAGTGWCARCHGRGTLTRTSDAS